MSSNNTMTATLLFSILLSPSVSVSDVDEIFQQQMMDRAKNSLATTQDVSLESRAAAAGVRGSLLVSPENEKISLEYARYVGKDGSGLLGFSLSSPISDDKKDAVLGTFDGLSHSTTIEVEYQYLRPAPVADPALLRTICTKVRDAFMNLADKKDAQALAELEKARLAVDSSNDGSGPVADKIKAELEYKKAEAAYTKVMEENDGVRDRATSCDATLVEKAMNEATVHIEGVPDSKILEAWKSAIGYDEPVVLFGVSGVYGTESFKYAVGDSFTTKSSTENAYKVSASYSRLNPGAESVFSVGYEYQVAFQEGAKSQICMPIGDQEIQSCSNVVVGAPTEKKRSLLYGEYRKAFKSIAIAPRLTYDFEESESGVAIPVWMLRNADGMLSGGVRLDWNSENDDIVGSVFVGVGFNLL